MKLFRKKTVLFIILFGVSIGLKIGALAVIFAVLSAFNIANDLVNYKPAKEDNNDNSSS